MKVTRYLAKDKHFATLKGAEDYLAMCAVGSGRTSLYTLVETAVREYVCRSVRDECIDDVIDMMMGHQDVLLDAFSNKSIASVEMWESGNGKLFDTAEMAAFDAVLGGAVRWRSRDGELFETEEMADARDGAP